MSLIENIIEAVSPKWALERQQARVAYNALRKYEAAAPSKTNKGRNSSPLDASAEIAMAGATLRNRARFAARNNTWARRGVGSLTNSIVGRGVKLTIESASQSAEDTVEALWKAWAGSKKCDHYRRKNLYGIQRQVVRSVIVDGEVLVRKIKLSPREAGPGNIPIALQVLEADFLAFGDSLLGMPTVGGGNYIDNGIEFDSTGRPVAYYLYRTHPGSTRINTDLAMDRVPASDILHIYTEERPGQNRGASELAASLIKMAELDDYEHAQIVRQKIAACFAVFVSGDSTGRVAGDTSDGYPLERVEPGMIERLSPGEQVTFGSPPEVKEFKEFTNRYLQGISAGMGTSFEAMTNDYSNVNFSSARMAWLEMHRTVEVFQDEIVVSQLGDGVWDWFLQAAKITSLVPPTQQFSTSWTLPRRQMIDPVKETKGIVEKLRARLISWQDAARELGADPETLFKQIVADMEMFDKAGVKTSADPAHDKGAETATPGEQAVANAAKPGSAAQ